MSFVLVAVGYCFLISLNLSINDEGSRQATCTNIQNNRFKNIVATVETAAE